MLRTARCLICGILRGDLEPAHEQPHCRAAALCTPILLGQCAGAHHRRELQDSVLANREGPGPLL
jgi:hypothetical protein